MGKLKTLIVEIYRRSLWQVLLIYVGAVWACFEFIATVADTMGLPTWLPGFAIALFLLGLPFVVAAACVVKIGGLELTPATQKRRPGSGGYRGSYGQITPL